MPVIAGDVSDRRMLTTRYQTPLRYPGAKSALSRRLVELLRHRDAPSVDLLVEPFAGGASVTLRLLGAGVVRRALLADADPLVAGFWQVVCTQPEALIDSMRSEYDGWFAGGGIRAVSRWDWWRSREAADAVESATKCLVLNRTTFSGILHGRAGPIGGRTQTSADGIACRFNPDRLERQIRFVGDLYAAGRIIDVWCKDWRDTLRDVPPASVRADVPADRVLLYLDPPYVEKSAALYRTSFDDDGGRGGDGERPEALHYGLADELMRGTPHPWVLSYDHHPELLADPGLYASTSTSPRWMDSPCVPVGKYVVDTRHTIARGSARTRGELLLSTLPAPLFDGFSPAT